MSLRCLKKILNKANLRDLIASTDLLTLNAKPLGLPDFAICCMTLQNNREPLQCPFNRNTEKQLFSCQYKIWINRYKANHASFSQQKDKQYGWSWTLEFGGQVWLRKLCPSISMLFSMKKIAGKSIDKCFIQGAKQSAINIHENLKLNHNHIHATLWIQLQCNNFNYIMLSILHRYIWEQENGIRFV